MPGLLLLLLLSGVASAQQAITVPSGATPAVPAAILEMIQQQTAARTNAAAATNATDNVEEPETFAQAVTKLKFSRTPETLFEAVKSRESDKELSDAERFHIAVILSDWQSAGDILKSVDEKDAKEAYSYLLKSLAEASQSVSQLFRQMSPSQRNMIVDENGVRRPANPNDRKNQRSLFLSDDLYAVIEAAPTDLEESQLDSLSRLIQIAIDAGAQKEFLTRLERGMKGLGGSTPSGRKLAAQLLSKVGWITEAGPYLPLERPDWDQADTLTLVLTMEYFTQKGIAERDERLLKRAAEVCAFMMQTSRFGDRDRGIFRQATDRFVAMLPALEAEDAEQLIRENFLTQPDILADLILALGESGQQAQNSRDLNLRGRSLATQNALLNVLASRKNPPPEAANVLVMNWLSEAENTYRFGVPNLPDLDNLNPYIYRPPSYYARRRNQTPTLSSDEILTNAPSPALVRRLNRGLAQRVNLTSLKLELLDPKEPATLDALKQYLAEHPGQEKELCEDYLAAWVQERSVPPEDPNIARMRAMGYVISRQQQSSQGIPLTRLRQNENIQEFKALLGELRALSPEPIDPKAVVSGFMEIHSGAEVYRAEDIEKIFGPAEQMNREELMQLVTGMRTRLRQQWQDPKVQQDAGTNRTEEERKDEVSRGYRTALDLVRRGLSPEDADWKEFIIRGQLFFDAAEYEFARGIKLSDYVDLREEAFSSYRRASEIYAAKIPEMPHGQWTIEPYQMWFFVMLGASDLSQLTRAAARSDPGLKQIGDAMRALPGEAAEGHLEKFGQMLADLLSQVPGNMRQRFLSAGLEVVGKDHPSAQAALKSLQNYEELLNEIQLRVTVDGPTSVGHDQPFGLFLNLEHTRQLGRESGGFGKYLQNASQRNVRVMPGLPANQRDDYRDAFAKNIHAALDETFEVSSITFHDPDVRPIDLPREGWQETPMAYVLLRAKEAAVDRIPSIQLDMDFSDVSGRVVLPVRSQVQPINAREAEAAARPCDDLNLVFTLDEREWDEGRAVVEITATGHGAIPPHTRLFDYEQEGFDVEVSDNGLSITEFVSDGDKPQPKADRNWQFTYTRKKDLRGSPVLHFPKLKSGIEITSLKYQHYHDADLVDLSPEQASAGVRLAGGVSSGIRNALIGLLLAGLGVGGFLWGRGKSRQTRTVEPGMTLPTQITPFSVAAFLRRIHRETGARLEVGTRQELQDEIRRIEAAFFSSDTESSPKPDLRAVAQRWLDVAG